MKLTNIILIVFSLILSLNVSAKRKSLLKQFDSLGGNESLYKKAEKQSGKNRVRIVQKRTVDRNKRFEFGLNAGLISGGDAYYDTSTLGLNIDFHINPKWSVGVRYDTYSNTLTSEGERIFSESAIAANSGSLYSRPDLDQPEDSIMGVATWYPIYGKLNLFNLSVMQFDVYTLVGGGQINLKSGSTTIYTAGGGVGFWFNQHISSRLEVKYRGYNDNVNLGSRGLNTVSTMATIGFML